MSYVIITFDIWQSLYYELIFNKNINLDKQLKNNWIIIRL